MFTLGKISPELFLQDRVSLNLQTLLRQALSATEFPETNFLTQFSVKNEIQQILKSLFEVSEVCMILMKISHLHV